MYYQVFQNSSTGTVPLNFLEILFSESSSKCGTHIDCTSLRGFLYTDLYVRRRTPSCQRRLACSDLGQRTGNGERYTATSDGYG